MNENSNLSNISEVELIKKITESFKNNRKSTIIDIGDDAALLKFDKTNVTISQDILVEGVHFDLAYTPLKHLGYKAVISSISDIYAMNGICNQITVSIAVSNRFKLESINELYSGIKVACKNYKVDLIGGDTTSSKKGLIISVTALGISHKNGFVARSGACDNDLIVVSGNLGGAYLGLQVLEREKQVFLVNPNSKPDLSKYKNLVHRQLRPEARIDIIQFLHNSNVKPTSMIDISDGLSSEIIHICKSSKKGCDIYEEKIPINNDTIKTCKEFNLESTTVALSGGEDYELLFTIKQKDLKEIEKNPDLSVIGHINSKKEMNLVTKTGKNIAIKSMGWKSF